jgi:hypothetical protein
MDLRGLGLVPALAQLERVLAFPRAHGTRVAVLIDPARPGGGETLFQPIGRRLVEARRQGLILGARPIPPGEGVGGFVLELAGKGGRADRAL